MKRNLYLVMEVVRRKVNFTRPTEFINNVFSDSDVADHLIDKFKGQLARWNTDEEGNQIYALFDFYMTLDSEHQLMFDDWLNKEIAALELTTIPHSMF